MSYPNRDTQSTHRFCGIASSFPRVHFVSPLPPPSRAPAGPSRALSSPGQPSLAQTHVPGPSRPHPASSHQPDCGRETAPVIVQPVVQDYFYQTRSQRRRTRSGDYITLSQTTFIRNVPPPTLAQVRNVSHPQSAAPTRTTPRRPTSTSQTTNRRAISTAQAPLRQQSAAPSQAASRNGRAPPPPPRPRTTTPSHALTRTSRPRTVTSADPSSESAASKHYHVPPAAAQLRQPRMPPPGFVIGEVAESTVSRAPSKVASESPVGSWAVNVASATWRERASHLARQSGSRH
ncbi:hypothetical protein NHJ13734_007727 [Beauveria thailandica]